MTIDRCDAAVVSILLYAIRFGYDIKLLCPISEILYYHITTQIIPQLCVSDQKCHEIKIAANCLLAKYNDTENAVGMGMSLGVDSMVTLKEYNYMDMPKSYRITHLTYHEVGAHHGMDINGRRGPYSGKQLFDGQLEKVKEFCAKYGYPLVVINSNIQNFLRKTLPYMSFHTNCTYRNVAAILVLQKLFGKFYCASAFNLDVFECDSAKDSEKYEKFLLPYLSTDNTKFYNSNKNWSRQKKVELLKDFEPSYDYLTVCLTHINNCGKCMKCRRTLMNLDVVGSLAKYDKSFDINTYEEHRSDFLMELWNSKNPDPFLKEILEYALQNDYEFLPKPDVKKIDENIIGNVHMLNIRELPSMYSKILQPRYKGKVWVIGEYNDREGAIWYEAITEDGIKGFCVAKFVKK